MPPPLKNKIPSGNSNPTYRYWAFISYSHRDNLWGRWLHRAIETYGIPSELAGRHKIPTGSLAPKRFHRSFRDREELSASPDLGSAITKALRDSHFLIIVCSPDSSQSKWVNKEIEAFQAMGRGDRILAIIVDGEPNTGDARECFPPALRNLEPIAADARKEGDGKTNAKLKLLAGMLGVSFDALKQRDTSRTIRRLQITIAVTLSLSAGFSGLAWYADVQRRKAVTAREEAESVLEFLVYDMRDDLASVGRIDLVDKVKNRVDDYYERLGVVKDDPDTLLHRAAALENAGNLAFDRGDLLGALREYLAAMELAERLVDLDSDNATWQQGLSVSQLDIGKVLYAQGKLDDAMIMFYSALKIRQKLSASHSDAQYQIDLSACYERMGAALMKKGNLNLALREFRKKQQIIGRLAAADPSNTVLQRELVVSHLRIGDVLMAQGNLEGALTAHHISRGIAKNLEALDPSNATWQRDLSVAQEKVGDVLQAQGNLAEATRVYEESMSIRRWLMVADPSSPSRLHELSLASFKLGDVLMESGDISSASDAYRDGMVLVKRLAKSDPSNMDWQRDLALYHDRMGRMLHTQGDLPGALAELRTGLEIASTWLKVDPLDFDWNHYLFAAHSKIGDVLKAQGDDIGAMAPYQTSRKIIELLAARSPNNKEFQRSLWVSYYKLAVLYERTEPNSALTWWEQAFQVLSTLKQSGVPLSSTDEALLENLRRKLH